MVTAQNRDGHASHAGDQDHEHFAVCQIPQIFGHQNGTVGLAKEHVGHRHEAFDFRGAHELSDDAADNLDHHTQNADIIQYTHQGRDEYDIAQGLNYEDITGTAVIQRPEHKIQSALAAADDGGDHIRDGRDDGPANGQLHQQNGDDKLDRQTLADGLPWDIPTVPGQQQRNGQND